MTLQQLAYFVAAASYGSFSAAAEALHMAQPSLSEQVRRLEDELGVELFARDDARAGPDRGRARPAPEAEARARRGRPRTPVRASRCARCCGGTAAFGMFGRPPHRLPSPGW